MIWPNARRYSFLSLVVVVSSSLTLAGPFILKALIDRAAAGASARSLSILAIWYLLLAVGSQVMALSVAYLATSTAWQTANSLRLQLAGHVLGLDHEFHRSHSPGELIERIDGDVTSVSDFLAMVVVRVLSTLVLIGGVVGVVMILDWRIGLGMAGYIALTGLVVFSQRDRSVAEAETEMSAGARLLGGIEERLTAAEDLRANGAGPYAVWRFVEDTSFYVEAVTARERAFLVLWRNLSFSVAFGAVLSLIVGAIGVGRGFLTLGTAFLLFQYSQQIRRPMEEIIHELELVQKANGAMVRVIKLMATTSKVADEGTTSPLPGPLSVEFDDVAFSYGDDELALDGLILDIAPGRSVGVVGHTGSGKTTISRLLARLVDAGSGQIRLGGVPIADIPGEELRRRVAVIPQTVDLMKGTVRDNLTFFDDSIADEAVDRALEQVGLDRFVGPARETILGPTGSGLSAGEAQLVALARVWLRQPDLVVLDEATARVDPVTEAHLERAISDLFENRTVFVIAHRLSTLQRVDEIVVVEHGHIVEQGGRDDLAADTDSRFHELLAAGLEVDQPPLRGVSP